MIQVIAAFFGSIGFAIVLKIHGKQIIYAGIGGMLTWITYLVGVQAGGNLFWSNFLAALFVAVYAEVMARVNKAPATIFLTAAAVPLIPGARLYDMMFGIVRQDYPMAAESGQMALVIALAIAMGFVTVAVIHRYLTKLKVLTAERKRS